MGRLGLGLVLVLRLGLELALGLQLWIGIGFRRNHSWSSTFTPRRNHSLCLLNTPLTDHDNENLYSAKMVEKNKSKIIKCDKKNFLLGLNHETTVVRLRESIDECCRVMLVDLPAVSTAAVSP